jgi:hypothetical protein
MMRRVLNDNRGVVISAAANAPLRESLTRTIIDEIGPEDSAIAVIGDQSKVVIARAIRLPSEVVPAIHAAEMLGCDTIVVGGPVDRSATRGLFDAASEKLVVLELPGDDPSAVAAKLVDNVSAFLVAGTLRAVLVARDDLGTATVTLHLVTDDVCRAILDIEDVNIK